NTSNVVADGRYLYSRLVYDINRANSISTPTPLGSSSANLALTSSGTSFTYALSNGNLILTTASSSSNLNSFGTTISNLSFTRLGNTSGKPTVKINFTVTGSIKETGGKIETQTFETTAGLR